MRAKYVLPCAVSIAVFAGCAGRGGASQSPAARTVETTQERSAEALDSASDAQKRAADQAKRAQEAQQEVQEAQVALQEAQQKLNEAQQKAEEEQQRAQQLQQEANRTTQQATQQATQAQQQATQALSQQGAQVREGKQTLAGSVSSASGDRLVVKSPSGEELTFQIDQGTTIQVDGRQASAAEIVPGADARVSYEVGATEPRALSVDVVTGAAPPTGGTDSGSTGTGSTGTGTADPSQDTPPVPEDGASVRP